MRAPSDMPSRRTRVPGRGRVTIIVVAVIVFVLFTSLRQIADFFTDYLWFDSLGFSGVWSKSLLIKFELGAIFTGAFFVVAWINLLVVDRLSPRFRPLGPDDELLTRYHHVIDPRARMIRIVVSMVFALITGAGMSSQWNEFILFTNGADFGVSDPIFGTDVGFYVFRLPFLVTIVDWVFASLIIVFLLTAVAYYLNGGIRVQSPFERVSPQVKAHLSVLLALLALTKAADYWLQRHLLLFSDRGVVNGATYTEVNAQLPAYYLLFIVALASFGLFIVNIRRRGWVLPIIAVGVWALVQLVVGEAYPAIYERLIVQPEQSGKETASMTNNIDATRAAYGLGNIETKQFDPVDNRDAAAAAVNANPATVRNIQLLDPNIIGPAFQRLQSGVAPYQFAELSTDRYPMRLPNGEVAETQVVIGDREMNPETIPQKSWEGTRLSYTHGYGFALVAGGAVTDDGAPSFAVSNIPLDVDENRMKLTVDRPQIYFGDSEPQYSIVATKVPEFDYFGKDSPTRPYEGTGGVALDSTARRMMFGVRFNDFNLVISENITDSSRILYNRDVRDRLHLVAPFLSFDSDPYPVVANGNMYYVVDAYTTSQWYPNSQRYARQNLPEGDLRTSNREFNYVRNSVKAVVDSYTGEVTLYVWDESDPVIAAYRATFPELFKNRNEVHEQLRDHFRYPQDLFRVQSDMWGRYHITVPKDFYDRNSAWEAPPNPPTTPPKGQSTLTQTAQQVATGVKPDRMAPYYVINKLPGDDRPGFMLLRSFQPYSDNDSKNKLTAFMVAKSDPDGPYGKLQVYEMKSDSVDGPAIVSSSILNDTEVSREVTLFSQQGSTVQFGQLLLVPVDRSILYVRALYVLAEGQTQVPQVKRVVVWFGGKVVIKPTLSAAIKELLPGSSPQTLEGAPETGVLPSGETPPVGGGTTTTTAGAGTTTSSTPGTVPSTTPGTTLPGGGDAATLIARAEDLMREGNDALRDGDLGTYQRKNEEALAVINELRQLLVPPAAATTTTTAPSA